MDSTQRRFAHPSKFDMMTNRDAGLTDLQSWDEFGFRVNNIYMRGSVVCLPKFTLLWDVQHVSDISPESLSPVLMLREPRIRILLIGTGKKMRNVNPALFGWFSRRGIAVEHMSTKHALSTFNVLNREGRGVAAALLSRKPVSREEGCYYRSSEHLPGFAGEGMSAAATAAAVVGPDEAMAHAATRGGVMVDVDSSAVSRSGSIRRAPQGFKPGGAVQTEVIRHDSHTGDDEEEEDDEDPLMVGYSAAARWRRINAGLDAVVPSIPLLSRRLARSQEELRREGADRKSVV